MDIIFREFFHKESIDFKKLELDTLIVFDTNTLLNIYRYSNDTRQKLIEAMREIQDNIWIPNQVMLEFNLNRQELLANLIIEKENVPKELSSKFKNFYNESENFINQIKIKSVDASNMKKQLLEDFKAELSNLEEVFAKKTNDILSIVDLTEDLAIEFGEIFSKRIGGFYTQQQLDRITSNALERFELNIPPGYKDGGKSENVSYNGVTYEKKYGDLIIWNQIMDRAKDSVIKKIVFVTDDNKTDWWFKVKGKTIGPRAELKNELLRNSEADLHMINSNQFLRHFTENKSNLIDEEQEKIFNENDINLDNQSILADSINISHLNKNFDAVNAFEVLKNIEKISKINNLIDKEIQIVENLNDQIKTNEKLISSIKAVKARKGKLVAKTVNNLYFNEKEKKDSLLLELSEHQGYLEQLSEEKYYIEKILDDISLN